MATAINENDRILYVDDEEDNLFSFKAVLRRSYVIDTASSAEEALTLVQLNNYKVVISDQRMPHLTGVDFFERLLNIQPEAIRIILTGYSDFNAIIDAINKGHIYYYITKPWQVDNMKIVINNAIQTYNLRQDKRSLERENIIAQFDLLRSQINPHILFNSLNALGSLIHIDAKKAIKFTREFAKFYRYILSVKDEDVITIKEELSIVNSFIEIQLIRFEGSLFVHQNIDEIVHSKTLPPFALQIVLEN